MFTNHSHKVLLSFHLFWLSCLFFFYCFSFLFWLCFFVFKNLKYGFMASLFCVCCLHSQLACPIWTIHNWLQFMVRPDFKGNSQIEFKGFLTRMSIFVLNSFSCVLPYFSIQDSELLNFMLNTKKTHIYILWKIDLLKRCTKLHKNISFIMLSEKVSQI